MPAAMRAFFMAQYGSELGAPARARALSGDSHSQRRQRAWVLGEQIGLREERSVLWYASDIRKPRCRIKPSAASAVYGGRKTADKKARPRLAPSPGGARSGAEVGEVNCHWQKGPASACAEPGSARSGAEVGEIKCHWHFIYGRSGAFRILVRSIR